MQYIGGEGDRDDEGTDKAVLPCQANVSQPACYNSGLLPSVLQVKAEEVCQSQTLLILREVIAFNYLSYMAKVEENYIAVADCALAMGIEWHAQWHR